MQDRRLFLQHVGYGALFVACGGDKGAVQPDASDPDVDAAPNQWASGGTAAMTDKATYPDPFAMPVASCTLVASTTLGPCTTATDLVREDISEGLSGLPMRLAIKVVSTSCTPLVGATVKVWHTNISGSYSGMTPSPSQCLADNAHASKDFFRGVATTNADGVVFFDSCYPGWYAGRAIHIHFQVKMGATSTRVSQLFFPEDISRQIFATHPEYKGFGQPDRTNAQDGIFQAIAASERDKLVCNVARMSDGAMLASKVVAVTT